MAKSQPFIIIEKAHIKHAIFYWKWPKHTWEFQSSPRLFQSQCCGGFVGNWGSASVRSLHPRCREEGEGAAHPRGAAEDGQRQSGVICGNCLKEHGLRCPEQGAYRYVQTVLKWAKAPRCRTLGGRIQGEIPLMGTAHWMFLCHISCVA